MPHRDRVDGGGERKEAKKKTSKFVTTNRVFGQCTFLHLNDEDKKNAKALICSKVFLKTQKEEIHKVFEF